MLIGHLGFLSVTCLRMIKNIFLWGEVGMRERVQLVGGVGGPKYIPVTAFFQGICH